MFKVNLVNKLDDVQQYPPTLQQAINGILKDPQKFQTQNYTSIRENRQIFFQYSVNLTVKLKQLQNSIQQKGINFMNYQALDDNILPVQNQLNKNFNFYPQTDIQKYQLTYSLSQIQQGNWDPITELLQQIQSDSNYVNGEQIIISDANSNTFTYPYNQQNREFDGTGLLFGLVFAKLEQVIFYVDVTSFNFESNVDHFFSVLELMNPYGQIKVYSVEEKVVLLFEGQVNDVRTKYLRKKFIIQRNLIIRGELLVAHMKQISTSLKTHVFILSQGIDYQDTLNHSFAGIQITVINTKMWQTQKVQSQSRISYFQQHQSIKSQVQATVYKFQSAIYASLIDIYNLTVEIKAQPDYIRIFRTKIFQILTQYLDTEVQYSPLIESHASIGRQQVIFLVLPVVQNDEVVGIVATSFNLQTIQEMIISQAPEYFASNLFANDIKGYNSNYIIKLSPGQLRHVAQQQFKASSFVSLFQKTYENNRILKSYQPTLDSIYLNIMSLLQLKKLQNGTVQNKQTIPKYKKDTIQYDPKNEYVFSVNQTYSEQKYLFSNQQKNESVQLLYMGQQCYVDEYKLLFEIKYNEHELLKYDNCTYFKQKTNITKCLCEFDNQLQIKLPFQSLLFVQNGNILNPYILEKYGIFDLLKQVTIRELLGLTECSENVNGQTNEYMFIIPGTDISMKITQQFLFYIRMWRYMNLLTQVYSQVSTERKCIFSHFNQMRLCTTYQYTPNVEIFDQTKLKYQQFEFANKHWLVPHADDEFPSTCHESWLFQSKQSISKDIYANSYEFSVSSVYYSMYGTYQGQVRLSPLSEPYSYSPYLYIQSNIDQNQFEINTYNNNYGFEFQFLYLDSAGFVISSTQQQSKGKQNRIINEFDIFDSQLCQLYKQSQILLDALFLAGLVKISYSITSGQVCTRFELQLNNSDASFFINNTEFYISRNQKSHIFIVTTNNADDMKIFQKTQDQLCFSSMQKYNEYLQKYFRENTFKFQTSGGNYSITDDYNLTYNHKHEEFKIVTKQDNIHYSSLNHLVVYIFVLILVVAFVQYNSYWIN
ncbi:Conserved_hypothetical protein [Hexamita inflata]|uniref:Transmembrane protein n=1 Tax=Hexamita inflata TaxID=28002 RepID=A0AA86PJ98_9EUKA|nr:Conserved hypothetical protein [Hexamita inflata]